MTPRQATLLGIVALVWGSSYLLIKYSLEAFSPAEVVFFRVGLSAVALVPYCLLRGGAVRNGFAAAARRPADVALLGLVSIAAPFLLISYGEKIVPVGLTAVLISPVPIFIAVLAPALDVTERLHGRAWLGLVAGLAGIALLVGVESIGSVDQFLGALAMLGAALSYAGTGFLVKRRWAGVPSEATTAWSVTAAALLTLPLALLTVHGGTPGLRAVWTTLVLGWVNTALAFVIFYRLIGEVGAGRSALVTYLTPPFSLAFGIAFKGESLTVPILAGLALILGGVALASRPGAPPPAPALSPSGTAPPPP